MCIGAEAATHAHTGSNVHPVRPHVTKRGSFVPGHVQTNPNGTKRDNFSTKGNVNPYNGKHGTKWAN
jgi:hypothetical protein